MGKPAATKQKTTLADLNRKPCLQRMNESFLATDLYAEPIRLNFKGAQTFPS
jgi:hypothetical protein